MDSFNKKINRISDAKEAIKQSLLNKGIDAGDNIEDYAEAINSMSTVVKYEAENNLVEDTTQPEGALGIVDNTVYVATSSGVTNETMFVPSTTYDDAQAAYNTLSPIGTDVSATAYNGMGGVVEDIQNTFNEIMNN